MKNEKLNRGMLNETMTERCTTSQDPKNNGNSPKLQG